MKLKKSSDRANSKPRFARKSIIYFICTIIIFGLYLIRYHIPEVVITLAPHKVKPKLIRCLLDPKQNTDVLIKLAFNDPSLHTYISNYLIESNSILKKVGGTFSFFQSHGIHDYNNLELVAAMKVFNIETYSRRTQIETTECLADAVGTDSTAAIVGCLLSNNHNLKKLAERLIRAIQYNCKDKEFIENHKIIINRYRN